MRKTKASRWGVEDPVASFEAQLEAKGVVRRKRGYNARFDCKKAQVVDRTGSPAHLERAAKSLKTTGADKRVLSAPQRDMDKAVEAMKRAGVSGTVSNLCGSRKVRVKG